MTRSYPIFRLSALLIISLLLLLWAKPASRAAGQSGGTEWTTPVNLSQSGAAGDVVAVEDSEGTIHVLWRDEIAGFVYTRSEDEGWASPATVELPFVAELTEQQESAGEAAELFVPQLEADTSGRVHAFWLNEEGTLLHSRVPAGTFSELSTWTEAEPVAEGILAVAIVVDEPGSLHLAYIQSQDTEESPSGIYYRRSDSGGDTWTAVAALIQSAYFRTLPPEQANVQVATTTLNGVGRALVAWDLPAKEKLFVIQSDDNGETWQEPREVDRRKAEDAETAVGPSAIRAAGAGSEVHLIWQAGHDGALCNQYHQWSPDGGDSWEAPQPILTDLLVCPDSSKLLVGQSGQLLLLATLEGNIQGGVYLAAWNGERWSELREQAPMSSFSNPETLRPVSFDDKCRQDLLVGEQLMVVGCSSGDIQDVWLMARPVAGLAQWFPEPSAWQVTPVLAAAAGEILFPIVIPDVDGWLHVLWSEAHSGVINYVRWDGRRWSTSLPVLSSATGVVDRPVATLTADRRLLVMWNEVESGQIYYSQADAERAVFAEHWTMPDRLPLPQDGATSVDMLIDARAVIYVAFAVPINEGRGIYLMRSNDLGETWSEPVAAFDAVANDWAMVDRPQLTVTDNEQLHLLWTRYAPPPKVQPQALVYARSNDGGQSWSEPQTVAQAPLLWSRITGVAENRIHRHWQETIGGQTLLWQETSIDNGRGWSYTSQAAAAAVPGAVGLAKDAGARLHLIYDDTPGLQYRLWNGDRWAQAESLALTRTAVGNISALDVAATAGGDLVVVFTGQEKDGTDGEQPFLLQFAQRPLDAPEAEVEAITAVVATPAVVATAAPALSAPIPSPSPASAVAPAADDDQEEAASLWSGLTLQAIVAAALLPAGLLVILVLVLGLRRTRV
jgi:hypothetical protein